MFGSVARYGDSASVGFDYGLSDGQSQTGAAYSATARLVGTVEAVEDVGKVFGGDAYPVVDDRDGQRTSPLSNSALSTTFPPAWVLLMALLKTFPNAWLIRIRSRSMSGRSPDTCKRQFNLSCLGLRLPATQPLRLASS